MGKEFGWEITSWSLGESKMKREELIELIKTNREIEFKYDGNDYSITYYNDGRKNYISFCKAYQKPIDVSNAYELLRIEIGILNLEQVFLILPDSAIDIY